MLPTAKLKHVKREFEELSLPTESQTIVRVIASRGNYLHEVENPAGEKFLVSMPSKFRRNIWVKNGSYVVVEPIAEGVKVKAEIVKVLFKQHVKWYKSQNCWPREFDDVRQESDKPDRKENAKENEESEDEDADLFVNTNRRHNYRYVSKTDSDSDSEDSEDSEDSD